MSTHYTRDTVWVVITSIDSLGSIPYNVTRTGRKTGDPRNPGDPYTLEELGIGGVYLNRSDPKATSAYRLGLVGKGAKVGLFAPIDPRGKVGWEEAKKLSDRLAQFAPADQGQTPVLLDVEPEEGSATFWREFLWGGPGVKGWRGVNGLDSPYDGWRGFRVTDFTPAPFKASVLPAEDLLRARFDVVAQTYFGDMSQAAIDEVVYDWEDHGYPREAIHCFYDGGRYVKPPMFYKDRVARKLRGGSVIWNANLLSESGLI